MKTIEKRADILIIGGGAAGCFAALTLAKERPDLSVVLLEKAGLKRSGCLAAGVNALNAYITPGHVPQDYVDYASKDADGIVREDLLLQMSEGLGDVTRDVEKLGLVILKDKDGNYVSRGWRNLKINGENIKPILAKAVKAAENVEVLEHVDVVDLLKDADGHAAGAWGVALREEAVVYVRARAVICATGGAAGLYRPNHPGEARHTMWYPPFNTGAGYAMGLRAGAEMTSFEMRFIALRCKDTIAPTGTLAQGVGAPQVNARGEKYQAKYGNTTSERLYAVVSENLAGRGPCYLETKGISEAQEDALKKAYLNMAPAQTMKWRETGLGPSTADVEVEGTEPYVVGGHTASGYWVDGDRQTTVRGLFAAGDVAGGCPQKYVTGAFVEGKIAAEGAAKYVAQAERGTDAEAAAPVQTPQEIADAVARWLTPSSEPPLFTVDALEEAMQQTMDEYAGGITTGYRYTERQLDLAAKHIDRITHLADDLRADDAYGLLKIFELRERLLVCKVLIEHLKARKETRWHSFAENLDHPEKDEAFNKYVNSRLSDGKVEIILRDLVQLPPSQREGDREAVVGVSKADSGRQSIVQSKEAL
ncbi:adenylyl-sulfate reductase subunit alpha [uncultured Selenomonas sp.]|uniref:adenylyl-sulfate reductase subunit alpha n=1 Tax=uncultured Selenomonas sp. TaxID=159275 RepID=UPI0025E11F37|nr:adenylyl-sulfate reductase subunit alpha [uncultured Selenomonas sp.]